MELFSSPEFLTATLATLAIFYFLSFFTRKSYLLLLLNITWLIILFKLPPFVLIAFLGFIICFYFAATRKDQRGWSVPTLLVVFLAIVFWLICKVPVDFPWHRFLLPLFGVSYTFCRLISFAIDLRHKKISDPSLLAFLNYILYFPGILSGPITKFEGFAEKAVDGAGAATDAHRFFSENLPAGARRIAVGLIKRNFLAALLSPIALPYLPIDLSTRAELVTGCYAYTLYLYLDFSGYSDIAIGLSKLLGIHVPENFNFPFLARNPQDFWARWHISLSRWLYEYVFAPVYTMLLRLSSVENKVLLASIAIFATFFLGGVWHGLEARFFREGCLHATALFVFINFDGVMRKHFPRARKKMRESRVVTVVSTFFTFHYFVLSLMLFSLDFSQLRLVFAKLTGLFA